HGSPRDRAPPGSSHRVRITGTRSLPTSSLERAGSRVLRPTRAHAHHPPGGGGRHDAFELDAQAREAGSVGNGQPAPRAGTDALAAVCVLLAVVTQLCLVWAYPLLPTNDGPAHQLTAWIYRRLADDP